MKKILLAFLLFSLPMAAQTIAGNINNLSNTELVLQGYEGFNTKEIAKTTTDAKGNFTLKYPKKYKGAAMLQPKNANGLIVLLNNENISIQWEDAKDFATLKINNSIENETFAKALAINQETEPKLAALKYLIPLYQNEANKQQWLAEEIALQESKYEQFVNTLPSESYASFYLKLRKLVSDFPLTIQHYPERRKQHEEDFKNINFNNEALWTSGLIKYLLEGYYMLIENQADVPTITKSCNEATDIWIKSLAGNSTKQQIIAEYCFKLLEKRSLVDAAEYLALAMLNQANCTLDEKRTNLFEQYRKMAVGNAAPNIQFNKEKIKDLKSLQNKFKLVVFGASNCPGCQTDYPKLVSAYDNLKKTYDVEIIYIALDTDATAYKSYYKDAPFFTFCDTKGWETQAAKDYHVFATPTYFLLSKDMQIATKIKSPEHLEAWLKMYATQQ